MKYVTLVSLSSPTMVLLETPVFSVMELAAIAANSVPLVTGIVYFIIDYLELQKKCDFYVLQAKRSSLDDCREYFLRPPSSSVMYIKIVEYIKIVYSRMMFDLISLFYDKETQSRENEMFLCASWSVLISLYLLVFQKTVFTCIVLGYFAHQYYLVHSGVKNFHRTPINDDYCRDQYDLFKGACSGNRGSYDKLVAAAEKGEYVAVGFVIFILTSNESNIDPDMERAAGYAHRNLDIFFDAASNDDIFALSTLAFIFMRGIHVPKDDSKALDYGVRAVRTDHPYANLVLGWVYLAKKTSDPENAYKYLKKAAKQGLASAQNSMGALNLIENDKYKRNPKKALFWFKQAALQNLRGAEYNLGALYNSDLLLECEPAPSFFSFGSKSKKQVREGLRNDAVYWLLLASQHGHRLADAELRKAEQELSDLSCL